jgi:site-specific DNA recombinase
MRGASYVRVSTERQQHTQPIEQQVTQLRSYIATHAGWEVDEAHISRDDGFSGGKLVRPGLDSLRDQAARAAFDPILITAPDRLARNDVHQMVVLAEPERRGVRVVFIDRPASDAPHDQLVLQIRGAVAEYERALIADRMRRGRLARLRRGQLLPWTRAPSGYRLHPERPRDPAAVQIDPAAAAIVRELFATYAEGGATLHARAVLLTGRAIPTPTGRAIWKPSTLRGLLTNPAYRGEATSGRLRTTPSRGRRSPLEPVGRGVSTQAQPSEGWITVPVPALVSAEQFELVRRRLAANQQGARRSTTHPYLLRRLVSCGVCQLACVGCTRSTTATRYRYYRCRGKLAAVSSGRAERCPARFTPAAQLDDLVWAALCAVLQHPEAITGALERAQSGAWVPDQLRRRLTALRGIQAGADRPRARLLDAYLAEIIDLATFERKARALHEREEEFAARERELVAQGRRLVEVGTMARTMTALCERLSEGLERASVERRRLVVDLLIDRVVVTDGAVEIR